MVRFMQKLNQTCCRCRINKPIEAFYFIKRSQSHETRCKACVRAYIKARHQADGGQALRESYQRRKAKGWTSKKWKDKTPEERKMAYEAVKRYRQRNREKCNAEGNQSTRLRRSWQYAQGWPLILAHYGNRCLRCGLGHSLCFDHVIPLSHAGLNCLSNGQPLCIGCNTAKGATEWCKDYRPDGGRWITELLRLNPLLVLEGDRVKGWHLTPSGRQWLKALWEVRAEWKVVMPGQEAQ